MKNQPKNHETELRENFRLMLIECVLSLNKDFLMEVERIIITETLLNNKTFAELKEINKLTSTRQKQILQTALVRVSRLLEYAYKNSENYLKSKKRWDELEQAQSEKARLETIKKALPPKTAVLLDMPLQELPLSNRAKSIFERNRIIKVSDLVDLTAHSFSSFRNSGRKTITEIETYFKENGLWWGMLD